MDTAAASALAAPAPSEPEDGALMARVAEGEMDAFAAVVSRYQDDIVGYLVRLTGSRDRAEDLAQETFLKMLDGAARYEHRGRLLGYLVRVATNALRSEERRAARHRRLSHLLGEAEDFTLDLAPAAPLFRSEAEREVARAVAALPVRLRAPLVLHEIEGWPYEEVATTLKLRLGTVKSRIHRARARLKTSLSPYWKDTP